MQLWHHQKEALYRAAKAKEFGLFFETGTGKTATTINILRELYTKHRRVLPTLVLCPPIMIETWRREFLKFSKIDPKYLVPIIGTGKQRIDAAQHAIVNSQTLLAAKIFITNYEALLNEDLFNFFQQFRPAVLVADEVHRCKNLAAKRTKATIKIADFADYRYILTGTPVLNTPLDLFAQFRILDRGETFGTNYFLFRATYFVDKNAFMSRQKYFPNWQIKSGSLETINKMISAKSMSVKKSECLDLPPLVRKSIYVDLTAEQRKHYESLKKDFITFLSDKACSAPLAITKALRLQQIVSGFLPFVGDEHEKIHRFEETPRMAALSDLLGDITEAGNKVIVWSVFKQNYRDIREVCEKLKLRFVEIHGEVSAKAKDEAMDQFQSDKDTKVLIGHPGSGGIGITLTAASYAIFYSRGFSLEHSIQAEARNYRGGSEIHEKITRIDLIAKDTIDELVIKALETKTQIGIELLKELK